jgi:PHD/YefM family antitoxin component YafN of YafNO toxin-antitoxin module
MNDPIRVPHSRYRRELRKWMRVVVHSDIIVTIRGVDAMVMMDATRYEEMVNYLASHRRAI